MLRMRAAVLLLVAASGLAAAHAPDQLAIARRFYNQGQFDQALEAAQLAAANPATLSSARLIMGRSRIERYRQSPQPAELDAARGDLRGVDPKAIDGRERIELQIGLAELLYFEDRFGAAAELLDPVIDASASLAPDAHERALDWWATAPRRRRASPSGWSRSCGATRRRCPPATGSRPRRARPAISIARGPLRPPAGSAPRWR